MTIQQILYRSLIDYAGLFPPASLTLQETIENYVNYSTGSDSGMLGRLVLPISRFDEALSVLNTIKPKFSLPVSALIKRVDSVEETRNLLIEAIRKIIEINQKKVKLIDPQVLEMALPYDNSDVISELELGGFIHQIDAIMDGEGLALPVFLEPMLAGDTLSSVDSLTVVLATHNQSGQDFKLGWKLRCGGLNKDDFPSSDTLSRFIIAAARHNVPVKATAGLHHPWPTIDPVTGARMHGFMNLLAATACAIRYPSDRKSLVEILDDDEPANFLIGDLGLHWRDHMFSLDRIKKVRNEGFLSLGSCSFDEPREDLRKHGIDLDFIK